MAVLAPEVLVVLGLTGVVGGAIAGIGGPGGPPVLLVLNLLVALSPPVAAATASSVFLVAAIVATGLYYYSDGIDWRLAALVGVPAVLGTNVGTRLASELPADVFKLVLAAVLVLAALGIVYNQQSTASIAGDWADRRVRGTVAVGSLLIGVIAGITGIGGPALTVPFMILLGIAPLVAIGAGLASGILITASTTLGHAVQGNGPALVPFVVVGVPYVTSQVIGWRYAHAVSERAVSYTVAGIAVAGSVLVVVL